MYFLTTVTPKQNKINWSSVKTVKKWETELHINLRHDVDDDGNVKTIICKVLARPDINCLLIVSAV